MDAKEARKIVTGGRASDELMFDLVGDFMRRGEALRSLLTLCESTESPDIKVVTQIIRWGLYHENVEGVPR